MASQWPPHSLFWVECRNRFLNHFSEMATIRQLDLISFIDE